ncbi:MAG: EutN/CcmL family microcompartment protein [Clostridiales bacterium]|jgi:ethanolamine utilization protein EutN|nr:EutN/CcmL family microcompartment protein [Clostridiales bacterium]
MIIGTVVGSVVSTRKADRLVGSKFMIVELLDSMQGAGWRLVAVDSVGAGVGETVLVATGGAARLAPGYDGAPVDAAIVGIIDDGAGLS